MTLKWALADDDGKVKSKAIGNELPTMAGSIFPSLMTVTPETLTMIWQENRFG